LARHAFTRHVAADLSGGGRAQPGVGGRGGDLAANCRGQGGALSAGVDTADERRRGSGYHTAVEGAGRGGARRKARLGLWGSGAGVRRPGSLPRRLETSSGGLEHATI